MAVVFNSNENPCLGSDGDVSIIFTKISKLYSSRATLLLQADTALKKKEFLRENFPFR